MSIIDFAVKFFQDSGVAIYFSIAIMAVGLSIAIERYVFLNKRPQPRTASSGRRCCRCCKAGKLQGGPQRHLRSSDAAIGKIVSHGLQRMQSPGAARRHRRRDGGGHDGSRAPPGEAHSLHRDASPT